MDNSKRIVLSRRKVLKIGAVALLATATGIFPSRIIKADSDQPKNPNQLGFMYDQKKCVGCGMCAKACQDTNKWEEGAKWRRVLKGENSKAFLSLSCNHCENPACVQVCPVKAYEKREKDGIVVHNPEKCIGCKYCMYACPYHAPQFSEATGRISKCHFCYAKQDKGGQPACVSKCPTKALTFGRLAKLKSTPGGVAELKGLPSANLTKPSWVIISKA